MKPAVSIIMPLYNSELYIRDSVISILNQSFLDFELLIINDGSTDNSLNQISDLLIDDRRIKVYNKINGGQGSARNVGLGHAKGKFVCFLDADDLWLPNKLDFQIFKIQQIDSDVLISSGVTFGLSENPISTFNGQGIDYELFQVALERNKFPLQGAIFKNYKLPAFNEISVIQNAEDYVFILECIILGKSFYGDSNKLFKYRIHGKQITKGDSKASPQSLKGILYLYQSYPYYFNKIKSNYIVKYFLRHYKKFINKFGFIEYFNLLLEFKRILKLKFIYLFFISALFSFKLYIRDLIR